MFAWSLVKRIQKLQIFLDLSLLLWKIKCLYNLEILPTVALWIGSFARIQEVLTQDMYKSVWHNEDVSSVQKNVVHRIIIIILVKSNLSTPACSCGNQTV